LVVNPAEVRASLLKAFAGHDAERCFRFEARVEAG
jgi:hypothetical protein